MTDNRDDAEALDGDALGEEVGDDGLPGTQGFPPDRPWGVEDPTRDVGDDYATREMRGDTEGRRRPPSFALVADGSSEGLMDTEAQEIGTLVNASEDDLSAEEGALHIESNPS